MPRLTPVEAGTPPEPDPAPGTGFAVVLVECGCEDPAASPPLTRLVDGRGRYWEPADVYGDFEEYAGHPTGYDLEDAEVVDGARTYAIAYAVPDDARDLRLVVPDVAAGDSFAPRAWPLDPLD